MTDKKKPYYGPAGLFSTDNPQSDRMQIEAEEYDDEEEYADLDDWDFDEESYNQPTTIYRIFECSVHKGQDAWYNWKECFESEDLVEMTKRMQAKHNKVCDCGQPIKAS